MLLTSAPDYGMKASQEILELAARKGYLGEHTGGLRLRELWNEEMLAQFDVRKLPDCAENCFTGQPTGIKNLILAGRAPYLKSTFTPFRLSYVALVIIGAQRVTARTPEAAKMLDHAATLRVLLALGADASLPAINGATPLHLASCLRGRPELVRILIQYGVDVNARDRYGQSPIFDAMLSNEVECVEALMEGGADVSLVNADGIAPIVVHPVSPQVTATIQRWRRKRAGVDSPAFESKICDGCHKKGSSLSLCSRCHTVRYCSRDCQRRAWKTHKQACTSFNGPTTLTIRPTYMPEIMEGTLVSTASLMQRAVGVQVPIQSCDVKPPLLANIKYPKVMIVKIQAPMGPNVTMDKGAMLVYDKRREFVACLDPSGGRDAYLALRKILAEHGVTGGLKAYFAAELVKENTLIIKSEVVAPQEF
ncbi:hypothetical protein AURDEDRAFT_120897 [Auricularia subglabra TFB-10046 SS5]|nr:hypothetical protein AURDEDRAFT_120897 [Auricularia subglabra TFB-10046 SS5]